MSIFFCRCIYDWIALIRYICGGKAKYLRKNADINYKRGIKDYPDYREVDGTMRVHNNTIFMGDSTLSDRHSGAAEEKKERNSIFAGDFHKQFDPITAKKEEARKQAMKIVGEAWAGDQKIDEGIEESRAKIREYQRQISEAEGKIREIDDERAALKDTYGITDDSREEQDLRLLEKKQDGQPLTEEEAERLSQIEAEGITEYQQRSLDLREDRGRYEADLAKAKNGAYAENASIASTKIDRLKHHAMVDAQENAEDIMEAASKEIVGMLLDEAKDHIDEEMEEKKEAAEEKAEKEEEEEEKIEKAKEAKEEKEEFSEEISEQIGDMSRVLTEADDIMDDVQREIKKLMDEMKLLDEDLKGAAVDAAM